MPYINCRVTDEQKEWVERRAVELGLDLSSYVRQALGIDQQDIVQRVEALEREVFGS